MTSKKDRLKELFETGKIPYGEHFEEFIDESYNRYKIVDMFNPNEPPSFFEEGESVLVFNYDPNVHTDWSTLLGPDVQAGDIMVRTLAYEGAGVWVQEFDTDRNGRYYPNKSRVAIDGSTWGQMRNHPEVVTVNNIGPDRNGNINIPSTGFLEKPAVTYAYHVPPAQPDWIYEFDINLPDYNPQTDILEFFRGGIRIDEDRVEIVSYDNTKLSLKVPQGWGISSGYYFEVWRYKYSVSNVTPIAPNIKTYKEYVEVPAGNGPITVHIPGIKEGNHTYFVGYNDGILRANAYEVEIDEVNELFIVQYTTGTMSRFTIIVNVFS